MGLITEKKFYSLERLKEGKGVIYILNDQTLLKRIYEDDLSFIRSLIKLKIDKLGLPLEIYRVVFSSCYLYSMPYFSTFKTLDHFDEFEKNFSDKEILIFFRNILEKVQEMHTKGLASGDMYAGNIMVDENLDYRFIDFDYATTSNFLGKMVNCGPLFLDFYNSKTITSHYSLEQQIALSDKMSILNMILKCMLTGTVMQTRELQIPSNLKKLELANPVDRKMRLLFEKKELVKTDDYFLEELDTLIKTDYKLPYRKKK